MRIRVVLQIDSSNLFSYNEGKSNMQKDCANLFLYPKGLYKMRHPKIPRTTYPPPLHPQAWESITS